MIRTELELRFIIDLSRAGSPKERELTLDALEIVQKQRVLHGQGHDDVDAIKSRVQALMPSLPEIRDATDRVTVIGALERCAGNVSQTAKLLCVSRETVHQMIHRFGIDMDAIRHPQPVALPG
jgi:transcriptional regulator of acetoin/glycerol metabolism